MSDLSIALVGSGPISRYHVPALESVGLSVDAVASMNPESDTVDGLAAMFGIDRTYRGDGWENIFEGRELDGVVVATHVEGTPEALRRCLDLDIPVLVEKPVAWTAAAVGSLRRDAHERVLVGYNRRYYRTTWEAVQFLSDHDPVLATVELPAATDLRSFLDMSVHGVDLLRHLFGDLEVLDTREHTVDDELRGFTATLRSGAGDLVTVVGNWNAPSNVSISLDCGDTRFRIEPYEQARTYRGLRIEEPTSEIPVRRYIPREVDSTDLEPVDFEYKPGFHRQARAFRRVVEGDSVSEPTATLRDAERALRLCESLLPGHLPLRGP
ncbi:Gfo/Idh/MocA family protein [Halobium salinum]|uniref:Gfo/Idh/MocA family protein n=1 Tax=Halobium salinum TaxID=1364940 RepID=A0ABD5PAC7_9EURY|nr:Gfo/Idh/MocA family oxidoreductase [Halobium salinum]